MGPEKSMLHEGIGNMAKAAETAVAQAEALIVELRRDTGDDLPPQPFIDNDERVGQRNRGIGVMVGTS